MSESAISDFATCLILKREKSTELFGAIFANMTKQLISVYIPDENEDWWNE